MVEIGTTACKWDSVIPLDEMWERLNKLIKNNGAICLFGNEPQMRKGKPYKATNKPDLQKGTNNYYKSVETINNGERYPLTTLEFNRVNKTVHPTQKPVALLEYLIKTYTNEGDVVLDFTMGSGSTGVACLNTNRGFIGIEKEEKYFNITKERIENNL